MARELPELHLKMQHLAPRYVFAEPDDFPYDLWVPMLVDIHSAQTIGEQRDAFTTGVISMAASHHGLHPVSRSRIGYIDYNQEARFKMESGKPRLSYLEAGEVAIGYQSPDKACPKPAFAVVDKTQSHYHRVVSEPTEELAPVETELGLNVIHALAVTMHDWYPGFGLFPKLADAGIPTSEEL